MADPGTRSSAAEVLLTLDRGAPVPLRAQLEDGLRGLIRSGKLTAGALMPSTRMLASDLGVSRRLVVGVYQQLTAEGYLSARERSATRVAHARAAAVLPAPTPEPATRYDLRPGVPDLGEFPRAAWLKATAHALRHAPDAALGYPDPGGAPALRLAVAAYLRRVRAVAADPQRVVICTGFRQALSLLTQTLGTPVIALEDPGLIGRDRTVAAAGGSPVPIPVDELGARTALLPGSGARAMVVAPAHQFPLGVTLAPPRRSQLLAWAAEADGLVIEDDYDAEFRYDRQPVGALQGLAPEHVAYVGTVSKTLAPALRLGWMVLPGVLAGPVTRARHSHDSGSPVIDQLTLAHLLDSGSYERHLRRMRQRYRQRRDALLAALRHHLPAAEVSGTAAGLHLVLTLPGGVSAAAVVEAAAQHDLALSALDRYLLPASPAGDNSLVLGYGNIALAAISTAIARLAQALAAVSALTAWRLRGRDQRSRGHDARALRRRASGTRTRRESGHCADARRSIASAAWRRLRSLTRTEPRERRIARLPGRRDGGHRGAPGAAACRRAASARHFLAQSIAWRSPGRGHALDEHESHVLDAGVSSSATGSCTGPARSMKTRSRRIRGSTSTPPPRPHSRSSRRILAS